MIAVVTLIPSARAAASQPALVAMAPDPTHMPDARVVYFVGLGVGFFTMYFVGLGEGVLVKIMSKRKLMSS